MSFSWADLAGRYGLVVSPELLKFVERAFVDAAPEAERDAVRAEALAEAAAAELEILADGAIISRAGAVEFYRLRVAPAPGQVEQVVFDKAPGLSVTLRMNDANTVSAEQAGKPDSVFARKA